MKNSKKFLFIALTAILLSLLLAVGSSAADAVASGTTGATDSLTWSLDSDGLLTLGGTGSTSYSQSNRAPWYTSRTSIKSIVVEEGVTSLGQQTFNGCSAVTTISLPKSLTKIVNQVFQGCSKLTEITFAEGMKLASISTDSFKNCTSLTSITLPDGCATTIGKSVFNTCTALTSVTFGNKTASVHKTAFTGCTALKEVIFRNPETTISCDASLFPTDVVIVGLASSTAQAYADSNGLEFRELALCGDNITWSLSTDGVLTLTGTGAMYDYSSSNRAPWYAQAANIKSILIGEGITVIGTRAFDEMKKVTEVTLPSTLTMIKDNAFRYCHALIKVNFTKSTTELTIGTNAFNQCRALPSITIPSNVVGFGRLAFTQCYVMTTMVFEEGITFINGKAFNSCKLINNIVFPASLQTLGDDQDSAFTAYVNSLQSHLPEQGYRDQGNLPHNG